ncbi:MAG: excinuclease ABC subunit C, partial [Candidatus Binatia bacterium]
MNDPDNNDPPKPEAARSDAVTADAAKPDVAQPDTAQPEPVSVEVTEAEGVELAAAAAQAALDAEQARKDRLREKADRVPARPGVYIFRDKRRKVLYVGKAKSLRDRVRSYVRGGDGRYQVGFLMDRAHDVETLVTASETEAFILENNLIKQYKPRYNINLKDDKSYVSVKVTTKDAWPRILVTRKIANDGQTYFGPFASASGIRETIGTIRKVFPLRTCSDSVFRNRSRPCLEYQIRRCLGPCVLDVDREAYSEQLRGAMQLLEGKTDSLVREMTASMRDFAAEERFEDAARVRDRISAIEKVAERQKVVVHGGGDRDVFGLYREGGFIEAQVLLVRAGKLVDSHGYQFEDHEFPDEEVLSSVVSRYYEGNRFVPDEILLPLEFEGMTVLAAYLTGLRERKVDVLVPQRGDKRRLVEMAEENAEHSFHERNDESARREKMLEELRKRLGLASTPKRIECFDISHTQGEAVVASMVAFDEGRPDKSGYRKYKMREVQRNDDFAA